jgi:hypothetical protein
MPHRLAQGPADRHRVRLRFFLLRAGSTWGRLPDCRRGERRDIRHATIAATLPQAGLGWQPLWRLQERESQHKEHPSHHQSGDRSGGYLGLLLGGVRPHSLPRFAVLGHTGPYRSRHSWTCNRFPARARNWACFLLWFSHGAAPRKYWRNAWPGAPSNPAKVRRAASVGGRFIHRCFARPFPC